MIGKRRKKRKEGGREEEGGKKARKGRERETDREIPSLYLLTVFHHKL